MNTTEKRTIVELPVDKIDQFPKHPYQVKDDDDMIQLVESIRDNGVISPVIVRAKKGGRYEMISGHRRLQACRYLGHDTIRGEILDLDKNAATIMMVDSNLARNNILPSEKAFAYKMRMEAIKKRSGRSSASKSPMETLARSDAKLAKEVGESRAQVQRYIRLTNLTPMLLHMVDERTMAMRPALELSFLPETVQDMIADCMMKEDCTPSHYQAIRMRSMFNEGKLDEKAVDDILRELKPNQTRRISLSEDKVIKYLPKNLPAYKREDFIMDALKHYDKYLKRRQQRER